MSGFTPYTASISGVRAMQYHHLNGRINNENWQFFCRIARNNAGRLKKADVPFLNNSAHDNSIPGR